MRSERWGLDPTLDIAAVPATGLVDSDERLRRSLKPVLDTLADRLAAVDAGIVLLDERAIAIDRRGTTSAIMSDLDRLKIFVGSTFREEEVGTNAGGTALEERRSVRVVGREHYAQMLQHLACYGVPLFQPTTRRIAGVLVIILPEAGDHPLMAAFVEDAARQIETLLAGETGVRERAQLEFFMHLAKRSRGAVLAAMDDAVMLNRRAEQFDPVDRAALVRATWGLAAADHGAVFEFGDDLVGEPVSVRVYTCADGVEFRGVVLETVTERVRRGERPAGRGKPLPGLVGRSPAWSLLCEQAYTAAAAGVPVMVVGEVGAGKAAVARAVHLVNGVTDIREYVLPDAAGDWLSRIAADLQAPGVGVILRNVCLGDERVAAQLAAEFDRTSPGGRLIATAHPASIPPRLASRFPVQIKVPPLRERRDDVELLAKALLHRDGRSGSLHLHPESLALLRTGQFPGNVAELERIITGAAAKRSTGDIMPSDLDGIVDAGPRHLTGMQRAEREAIIAALAAAQGNKRTAAESLGISRATLYRRIADYRIDVSGA